MRPRRSPANRVEKKSERERTVGLDPDDEAARWLEKHDPKPAPTTPKGATKSKLLHQWKQRQQRGKT